MEQRDNVVQLRDEGGNSVSFRHLITVERAGNKYVLLEAVQDMEDCMEGESVILRIERDESGEDVYVTIEDEAELQAVCDICIAELEELDAEDEREESE